MKRHWRVDDDFVAKGSAASKLRLRVNEDSIYHGDSPPPTPKEDS